VLFATLLFSNGIVPLNPSRKFKSSTGFKGFFGAEKGILGSFGIEMAAWVLVEQLQVEEKRKLEACKDDILYMGFL
jgi:hypothetical protein